MQLLNTLLERGILWAIKGSGGRAADKKTRLKRSMTMNNDAKLMGTGTSGMDTLSQER